MPGHYPVTDSDSDRWAFLRLLLLMILLVQIQDGTTIWPSTLATIVKDYSPLCLPMQTAFMPGKITPTPARLGGQLPVPHAVPGHFAWGGVGQCVTHLICR